MNGLGQFIKIVFWFHNAFPVCAHFLCTYVQW